MVVQWYFLCICVCKKRCKSVISVFLWWAVLSATALYMCLMERANGCLCFSFSAWLTGRPPAHERSAWWSHPSPLPLSTAVWLNLNKQIVQWAFLTFQQPHRGNGQTHLRMRSRRHTQTHTHHTLYSNTHTFNRIFDCFVSLRLSLSSLSLSIFSLIKDVPPFPQ